MADKRPNGDKFPKYKVLMSKMKEDEPEMEGGITWVDDDGVQHSFALPLGDGSELDEMKKGNAQYQQYLKDLEDGVVVEKENK